MVLIFSIFPTFSAFFCTAFYRALTAPDSSVLRPLPQGIANTVWAYATLEVVHQPFIDALAERAQRPGL
jgi:hypothetical protein